MLPPTLDAFPEDILCGCDECGRGPLFGDVCAAAVVWPLEFTPQNQDDAKILNGIKDSKKMTAKQRAIASDFIKKHALAYGIATVSNHEIDSTNILIATYKAMHLALDMISVNYDRIAVDGNRFKRYMDKQHVCVVGGDNKIFQIAAASILAKEYRDSEIIELVKTQPELAVYKLEKNKGYGTKEHMNALREHGITPYHRKSFIHI